MIKRSNTQPQTNGAAIAARMKTTALDQLANGGSARLALSAKVLLDHPWCAG
jgi:hypothetical protein